MKGNENLQNADWIDRKIKENLVYTDPERIRVLDICCGVYSSGSNYDQTGEVYEPVVAQFLAKNSYEVTGIDFRKNNRPVKYNHISNINVLDSDWHSKLTNKFNVVCFLRSWDTPEILLEFQKKFGILDVNQLTFEIAKYFLPDFVKLLGNNGLLFITDVFREDLGTDEKMLNTLKLELDILLDSLGLQQLSNENGLWCFRSKPGN